MKRKKTKVREVLFRDLLKDKLKDPEFKRIFANEGVKLRIGMRIAELRKGSRLTQAELAKRVGVTQGFIAQLEAADTDNCEVKTLQRIAEAIGTVLVIGFISKSKPKQKTVHMLDPMPL